MTAFTSGSCRAEADRALAGDDVRIVEGGDEDPAAALGLLFGAPGDEHGVRPAQDDLGAVAFRALDLVGHGLVQHDDAGPDPALAGGVGDGLRVVSAGGRGDALAGPRQARDAVGRPADLEGPRALEVLALEEDAGALGELHGQQRRADRDALDAAGGGADIGQRDHSSQPLAFRS
jgi:hypothetical protein